MAQNIYSKPYSQNGDPVGAIALTNRMIVSVKVPVTTDDPYGYKSHNATLAAAQSYFFNEIKVNGINTYIQVGAGLAGSGTADDALRLDLDWMNSRYHSNVDFPISQVGDMTDFTLPISGSYFSVVYPLTHDPFRPTAFVEGNGDLRILNHVTNGEDFRVVNGVCKNYRNNSLENTAFTDIVYRPPGLLTDEYIHNVFTMSTTAMIAEIWDSEGFKEYCFITLNGTAIADYHTITRLGLQPIEIFYGPSKLIGTELTTHIRRMRWMNLSAVIVNGNKYIIHTYLDQTDPETSYNFTAFASVNNAGVMSLMTNWQATNVNGNVRTNLSGAYLHENLGTRDPADIDAMHLLLDPIINITSGGGWHPVTSSAGGITPEGYVMFLIRRYDVITTPLQSFDAKPNFYYCIDFINRRVFPAPAAAGKRWDYSLNANNYVVVNKTSKGYLAGHYYANMTNIQLLGDGNRVGFTFTTTATDIQTTLYIYRGTGTKPEHASDDAYFVDNAAQGRGISVVPPTPVLPLKTGFLLYDTLLISNTSVINAHGGNISKSLSRLIGSPTAKNFEILQTDTFAPPVTIQGYALNNDREVVVSSQAPNIVSVRKNGVVKYHNGMWGRSEMNAPPVRMAGINTNYESSGNYSITAAALAKIDDWAMNVVPRPVGYPDLLSLNWIVAGPLPGHTSNHVWIKLAISFKIDDATDLRGYKPYGSDFFTLMVPCTLVVSGSDLEITDIDFTGIDTTPSMTGGTYLNAITSANHGALAIDVLADKYSMIYRGGGINSTHTGSSNQYLNNWAIQFDAATGAKISSSFLGGMHIPTIHPTHGFGFIENNITGMGAFYIFTRYGSDPIVRDDTYRRVIGTSRPAAGFSLTVSAPIPVYSRGSYFEIPPQSYDLTTVKADPRFTVFYMYAVTDPSGTASLVISLLSKPDTDNTIYLGKIETSDTEIVKMDTFPITRWENHRPSAYLRGASIPVSGGAPSDNGYIAWPKATITTQLISTPGEYSFTIDTGRVARISLMAGGAGGASLDPDNTAITQQGNPGEDSYLVINGVEVLRIGGGKDFGWMGTSRFTISEIISTLADLNLANGGFTTTTTGAAGVRSAILSAVTSTAGTGGNAETDLTGTGDAWGGGSSGWGQVEIINDTAFDMNITVVVGGGGLGAYASNPSAIYKGENGKPGCAYIQDLGYNPTKRAAWMMLSSTRPEVHEGKGICYIDDLETTGFLSGHQLVMAANPTLSITDWQQIDEYYIINPADLCTLSDDYFTLRIGGSANNAVVPNTTSKVDDVVKDGSRFVVINNGWLFGRGGDGNYGTQSLRKWGATVFTIDNGYNLTVFNDSLLLPGGSGNGGWDANTQVPGGGGAPFGKDYSDNAGTTTSRAGVLYATPTHPYPGGNVGKPSTGTWGIPAGELVDGAGSSNITIINSSTGQTISPY